MKYSRACIIVSAFLLSACGASAAAPQPSKSEPKPVDSNFQVPMPVQTQSFADFDINVILPQMPSDAINTLKLDSDAMADIASQTGCKSSQVVTYTTTDGNVYPLGAFYTCGADATLSGTTVMTTQNGTVIFTPAAEVPMGLSPLEAENYKSLVKYLNTPTNYSSN